MCWEVRSRSPSREKVRRAASPSEALPSRPHRRHQGEAMAQARRGKRKMSLRWRPSLRRSRRDLRGATTGARRLAATAAAGATSPHLSVTGSRLRSSRSTRGCTLRPQPRRPVAPRWCEAPFVATLEAPRTPNPRRPRPVRPRPRLRRRHPLRMRRRRRMRPPWEAAIEGRRSCPAPAAHLLGAGLDDGPGLRGGHARGHAALHWEGGRRPGLDRGRRRCTAGRRGWRWGGGLASAPWW